MATICGVVENTIRSKLRVAFDAKHLDVINESHMHSVPKNAETHFKVVVVSDKFEGLPLIKVSALNSASILHVMPTLTYSKNNKL